MQLRRRWQACGWLLVSLSLVSMAIFTGCEKAGGGGGGTAAAPPSGTTPSSPPPPTPAPATPVVGITLEAAQPALLADGVSSTTITADLITASGAPAADGTPVTLSTDLGRFNTSNAKTVTVTTTGGSGSVVVPFISEADVAGIATIIATAQDLTQKLTIELVAVAPSTPTSQVAGIVLQADASSLVANGTSSTIIRAALITSTGDLAGDGVEVHFTTDLGRFTVDGAKTAAASTSGGTGTVLVPFISEKDVVGTATIVANVGGVAQSIQIALTGAGAPAAIILTADSNTISLFGTTGITAQVLDGENNPVADGTSVLFTTSLAGTGVTPSDTTVNGLATTIFSAGTLSGVATVVATSGTASATVSIAIAPGPAGSLEFISAVPTVIGVKGSALPQKSTLTFRAGDVNGNAVADGTLVTFTLISGVNGGEKVEPTQVGTTAGLASTILTSGIVSGPVRVQASVTVGGITLTSSSTNVSIAGGTPSAAHMGVAPAFLNIAGRVTQGIICPVTAIVGDRFGNPIPQNTAVSFFTNGGVIGAQGLTDELGNAPTDIKTGPPTPRIINSGDPNFNPNTDPRTGFVSITAITQGEETFIDSNGNGLFDGPQEFDPNDPDLDTPEPFIDHVTLCNGNPPSSPIPCPPNPANPPTLSGDGQFDPTDRFELFFDGNGNGTWDTPNGVWDANKPIFASTRVLFSGPTVLRVGRLQGNGTCLTSDVDPVLGNPDNFFVPNGGFAITGPFCIVVSDAAGHPLVGGTTITITTSKGVIAGTSEVTIPDTQRSGPGITLFSFTVGDDDSVDPSPIPEAAVVTITVESDQVECPGGNDSVTAAFGGSVD